MTMTNAQSETGRSPMAEETRAPDFDAKAMDITSDWINQCSDAEFGAASRWDLQLRISTALSKAYEEGMGCQAKGTAVGAAVSAAPLQSGAGAEAIRHLKRIRDDVFHEEQLQIWSDEILADISPYVNVETYDDGVALHEHVKAFLTSRVLERIGEALLDGEAVTHPQETADPDVKPIPPEALAEMREIAKGIDLTNAQRTLEEAGWTIGAPMMVAGGEDDMQRGVAYWTYDDDVGAWYFGLCQRADPPYLTQRHFDAIVDLDADGRLAGIELLQPLEPSRK